MRTPAALVLVLGLACRRGAPARSSPHLARPELALVADVDLGAFAEGTPARATLTLRNVGTEELRLLSVERSRFCSGKVGASTLAPGAGTSLEIVCQSDLPGPLHEHVIVSSNDPRAPAGSLVVSGVVLARLAFDVPAVDLATSVGRPRSVDVRLVGTRSGEAHLALQGDPPPGSSFVALPGDRGEPKGFRLTCLGHPTGRSVGHLVFDTGLDDPPEVGLSWSCRVAGTLRVSPGDLYFDLSDPRQHRKVLDVASTQPGFVVRFARVTAGPFIATRDHDRPSRVTVVVDPARVHPEAHGVTGTLVIGSNDRTEPRREVPLFGFGRMLP